MKSSIKYILLLLAFLLGACEDVFDHELITTNPNAVTRESVPMETLLSGTLLGVTALHEDTDTRISYMWSGQMTGAARQHLAFSQYIVSADRFTWDDYYATGADARIVQEKADENGDSWHKGIAQVAEALIIAKLTSFWGDVPYSQAFNIDEYPSPVYDSQPDVYSQLQTTLDVAIENLSVSSGTSPGSNDIIYGGDVDKWVRAAYTLKARLYMHLGEYEAAVENALQGISTPEEDALAPHGNSQGIDQNSNYAFFVVTRSGDTNFSPPAVLPTLMEPNRNAKTDDTALYNHFFQFGLIQSGVLDANVNPDGFFAADAYQPLLTYYENQLILAESYARLNDLPAALEALNSVRSVLSTGYINGKYISEDNLASGIKYEPYVLGDFSGQTDLLYEIMLTKYMVSLSQYESFNDVRRLKVASPVVTLPVEPIVSTRTGNLPGKYIYPTAEITTNPNIPEVTDQFETLPIF
ncbi:tetratricopeptide (TPR) repeat protein [Catalinimonas alkaloidigena]|uniref:SusD/RagB family nutrient-binding outer membrane lipoprotein n=1 Tax=Catalinimonas alkaloidigena TaxID=1075417 RepID=UPI002404CF17|nr:SusD/RagB family nutrient-binding outer membrane lipoprotein [Catalinimonas alkaloidigena]MDF9795409.1 tetratricopeptide (TPR) repeat protein [Catalinimonas alkaloidigena]